MAVTALSLHEYHPDGDIPTEGSSCEEEEEEVIANCDAIRDLGTVSGDIPCRRQRLSQRTGGHLHRLRERISKTCPTHQLLSPQAILLLSKAATTACIKSDPALINDPATAPLYAELQALRELIPAQPTMVADQDAAESSPPYCLITHALDYLALMNLKIQSLHEVIQLQTSSNASASNYMNSDLGLVKVEHVEDSKLRIHVQCKQRNGLLSSLLAAVENLALVIDQMDVSSNQMLTLDLITSKVNLKRFDQKYVEQVLHDTIFLGLQDM